METERCLKLRRWPGEMPHPQKPEPFHPAETIRGLLLFLPWHLQIWFLPRLQNLLPAWFHRAAAGVPHVVAGVVPLRHPDRLWIKYAGPWLWAEWCRFRDFFRNNGGFHVPWPWPLPGNPEAPARRIRCGMLSRFWRHPGFLRNTDEPYRLWFLRQG